MKPLESTLRTNLTRLIRGYAKAAGLETSSVCNYAYGDSRLMEKVESGSAFTVKTYDKLVQWFTRQAWKGHPMPVLIDPKHEQEKPHGKKASSIRDRCKGRKVVSQAKSRKASPGKGSSGETASGQARR